VDVGGDDIGDMAWLDGIVQVILVDDGVYEVEEEVGGGTEVVLTVLSNWKCEHTP